MERSIINGNFWRIVASVLGALVLTMIGYFIRQNDQHWETNEKKWREFEKQVVSFEMRLTKIDVQLESINSKLKR